MEHELPLDDVFFGTESFGVLNDGAAGGIVGIDEVGDVSARAFDKDFLLDNLLIAHKWLIINICFIPKSVKGTNGKQKFQ